MLAEFLPLFDPLDHSVTLLMQTWICLFVPVIPEAVPVYMPFVAKFWPLLRQSQHWDAQWMELVAATTKMLTRTTLAPSMDHIFSAELSNWIFSVILHQFNLPFGVGAKAYEGNRSYKLREEDDAKSIIRHHDVIDYSAQWIVWNLRALPVESNVLLNKLQDTLRIMETFFHPSNTGNWTMGLARFIEALAFSMLNRVREGTKAWSVTDSM